MGPSGLAPTGQPSAAHSMTRNQGVVLSVPYFLGEEVAGTPSSPTASPSFPPASRATATLCPQAAPFWRPVPLPAASPPGGHVWATALRATCTPTPQGRLRPPSLHFPTREKAGLSNWKCPKLDATTTLPLPLHTHHRTLGVHSTLGVLPPLACPHPHV